jgi:SAM-dependent methyltransferase
MTEAAEGRWGIGGPRWYNRVHAWLLAHGTRRYERMVAGRKRALLGGLAGTVVEIGPGAGANLPYYGPAVEWIGVEPNPYAHGYLRERAAAHGVAAQVVTGVAERLPLPAAAADAVVCTLVLCTVRDPAAALAEARRVLRPGGRFLFIEHVAAPRGSWLRRVQRALRPAWRLAADGCEPDRETWRAIERAGFREVRLEHFRVRLPLVSPHITGTAVR